ncbi:esterase B1-like [Culicoides brevitarsis]|uniref:esterase B1-like n=1 Tax=Culicoides brevitarsis TaxID=469753 RepID=UPI00307B93BD
MSIIETTYGHIKGIQKISCYDNSYLAFYGVPYAKQPVGEYRFKDPRPLEAWEGVLDATKVGDACWNFDRLNPNPNEKKIIGSDNCLHLNIYVPHGTIEDETKKKPVMVYIHGGRFATMSANPFYYGPDFLMEQDVILVTINYRLGAFGFLSLDDPSLKIPGNAGIKDQLMALKWVQSEIGNFGGDSQNVTLFGESAGACSVHLHLLYEPARGLFQRAIIMSGSAFGPWSVRSNDNQMAYRLAKALGYKGDANDDKEVFKVISEADPNRIVQLQNELLNENEKHVEQLITFGPVVEPYLTEMTFIKKHPLQSEVWQTAWGNSIDVMIGGCSLEGLLMYPYVSLEKISALGNFSHVIAQNVQLDHTSKTCIEKGLKLKNFYYGTETPSMDNVDIYIDIQTDKNFWHGMWMAMKAHRGSNTYLYRFDVAPSDYNQTIRVLCNIPHQRGAAHVEDVFYIFKAEYLELPMRASRDDKIIRMFSKSFGDFAKDGNPSPKDIIWRPVESSDDVKCLNINENEVQFISFPEKDRMKLWDEICETNF